MSKITNIFYFACLILLPFKAMGQTFLDHDYISAFAHNAIQSQLTPPQEGTLDINISDLDPRVQIQPCNVPLEANIPENHNGRNVNIEINCPESEGWRLFLTARIKTTIPVIVATSNIQKGSILDQSNLKLTQRDITRIRGEVYQNISELIGAKSTRTIRKGATVGKNNICLVCKGETVTIVAESSSLAIKTIGIALTDGVLGEEIKVRNKGSGRVINAQISALNLVKIIL